MLRNIAMKSYSGNLCEYPFLQTPFYSLQIVNPPSSEMQKQKMHVNVNTAYH